MSFFINKLVEKIDFKLQYTFIGYIASFFWKSVLALMVPPHRAI